MRRVFLVLVAITLASGLMAAQKKSSAKGGSDSEQQVASLMDQGKQAALKGDTGWQEQHMAENFVGINSRGERMSKSDSIASRKNGDLKYQSIDEDDRKIRVYGDSAIVNMKSKIQGSYKGQDMSGDYWSTFVWAKQNGAWKLVSMQSTRIREENK